MSATVTRDAATGADISEPAKLDDQQQIPAELSKGRWVVYAHEWLPVGTELADWKKSVTELCRKAGLVVELTTDSRSRVTIVMSTLAMPKLEQIEASIAAIEVHRGEALEPLTKV